MKFVTFIQNNIETIGIMTKDEKGIIPINEILENDAPKNMKELILNFSNICFEKLAKAEVSMSGIDMSLVKIIAPIPTPERGIICLGKNYREHVKEVASAIDNDIEIPEYPIYFSKLVDKAIGSDGIIPLHKDITDSLDYEAELAVIIGKEGKDIPFEKVEEYIFGYTIINDVSVRDLQRRHRQWFRGKSVDGSCPMGPCIVDKSEIKFPVELDIKCYVNGNLRQDSNTREFIFDIPYVISEFSKGLTLKVGDIISTGTPSGVGMGFKPPKYLNSGDKVECIIDKIGILRNVVI